MKNGLIASLVLLLIGFAVGNVFAQQNESTDQVQIKPQIAEPLSNEAILALSYQNGGLGFGIIYKKELKRNRFVRVGLTNVGINYYTETPSANSLYKYVYKSFEADLMVGYEFRFQLHPKVFTYTGIDVLFGFQNVSRTQDYHSTFFDDYFQESYIFQAGLAFNSGVQVKLHELVMLGINITPNVFYARRIIDNSDEDENISDDAVSTSFNSAFVQATVVIHWPRKRQ